MNIKRPLLPGFLKTADQKLLLNRPGTWSTRAHLVVYYGLLFMIGLAIVCFLDPKDLRSYSSTEYWVGFVIIICIIALTVWLIYLLRFNLFKKYGILPPQYHLVTFLLYFVSSGIIVLFTYVQPAVESFRANMAYGDEEIVNDINAINLKICRVEYDMLQMQWDYDTVMLVKDSADMGTVTTYDKEGGEGHYLAKVDSVDFKARLNATDSLVKLNDTTFIDYETPNYAFVGPWNADFYTKGKMLSAMQIYHQALRRPPTAGEKETTAKELKILLDKYHYEEHLRWHHYDDVIEKEDGPLEVVNKRYHIYHVDDNFSNIISKKYEWNLDKFGSYFRVFFYFTLGITLLIFIFRHTTVKTFFLSLLTALLLTILTGLFMAFTSSGEDTAFFALLIVYTLIFFIGSLSTFFIKKREVITGITTNLFVFMVPIFPLLVVSWYYTILEARYDENSIVDAVHFENKYMHLQYGEIGGILLFFILLATYIGKVYRRWYSLPEA